MRWAVPSRPPCPTIARTAALLSDGTGGQRQLTGGPLIRSARAAGQALRNHVAVMSGQPASAGAAR